MLLNRDDKIQNREKALGIAVEKKNADLARLFVQHGMNFECLRNPFDYVGEDHNEDPYFWPKRELTLVGRAGKEEQSQEMIELFLDHGGGNVDDVDRVEFTALKYACLRGQYKLAKFLIERGAEISFDPDGTDYTSPLIIACEQSHESIVELLLDHGAHTDAPYGRDTPLMITCKNGAMVSFKKLLTCDDVCIDEQNRDGCTALMIACANAHLEMVKLLLKRGAEVDMQDHKGRRALAYSANEACIQCLLEHSVRLGPRAISDEELLRIVSSRGCTSMVKELLEKGVNVNCKDRGGFTPLMRAASGTTYAKAKTLENKNFVTIAKSLVSQGAEVNAVNKRGQTALELTACKNLAHFLLDQGATYDPSHTGVYSIFSRSCEEGWVDLTRRCLQQVHKSDASKNMMDCLVHACRNQRTEIVKLLLDNGADPKAGFENWRKKAWLLKEVCVGKVNNHKLDLVQLLLQSYVCSNIKDKTAVACALHGAYEVGDLETARLLVQHGADVDSQCEAVSTCLMKACQRGDLAVVRCFLEFGANVNQQNNDDCTALMLACNIGQDDMVCLLLDQGAEVNQQTSNGWSALHIAACGGNVKLVQSLLNRGAAVNLQTKQGWTSLMSASDSGNMEIAELLLQHGAKPEMQLFDEPVCSHSWFTSMRYMHWKRYGEMCTALSIACKMGNERVVQLLLAHVDAVRASGASDLATAYLCEKFALVDLFRRHGFGVNLADSRGRTVLMQAIGGSMSSHRRGHPSAPAAVKTLLDHGADLHARDKNGATALFLAIDLNARLRHQCEKTASLLLTGGADPNTQDSKGTSPLMRACFCGSMTMIHFLIKRGAKLDMQDGSNTTALMHAAREGHIDIVQTLIQYGAKVDVREGSMLLFHVAVNVQRRSSDDIHETMKLLVQRGARMDFSCLKSKRAQTALKIVYDAGFVEVVDLFTAPRMSNSALKIVADSREGNAKRNLTLEDGNPSKRVRMDDYY